MSKKRTYSSGTLRRTRATSSIRDLSKKTWARVIQKTINAVTDQNLPMLGASIAFGGTLAFFPLVAACVAIASMVIRPEQLHEIIASMSHFLPRDIHSMLTAQITNAMADTSSSMAVAVVAIVIAIFGVSGAVSSVVSAVNMAYGLKETRSVVKIRLMSMAMTFVMIIGMLIMIPLVTVGRPIFESIGTPEPLIVLLMIVRWPIMAMLVMIGLAIFYRYAPNRSRGEWQWLTWGSVIATLMWIVATALFFVYLQYFAGFSNSYSLFAGIVALMLWLNVGGVIILIGAEINRQLEERSNKTPKNRL